MRGRRCRATVGPLGNSRAEAYRTPAHPLRHAEGCTAGTTLLAVAPKQDNARRYTRVHTMAVTLQLSLLPRGLPEQSAL
ncbi:hypothetical protein AB0N17_46045, partial [Streptomyces sp. NPDC051133]|uniref:hypothetical protein n=1 Tax=Streptomyces sp. NPDC051133 TaxID=3155521 RepID=UPI00343DC1CE